MKVRELLTDESKWTQGREAIRPDGDVVSFTLASDPQAIAWCLTGALDRCYCFGEEWAHAIDAVIRYIGTSKIEKRMAIAEWNDAPARTFADVKALVDELDI